jgi:hypothetical protein
MDGDTFAHLIGWILPVIIIGNVGLWLYGLIWGFGDNE